MQAGTNEDFESSQREGGEGFEMEAVQEAEASGKQESSLAYPKLVVEMMGTALLCFTIATSGGHSMFAPLAIGTTLMACVYLGGHISGGHYNPAVSLAVLVRGQLGPGQLAMYVVAQISGAFVGGGAAVAIGLDGGIGFPAIGLLSTPFSALLAEVVLTFSLAHTVLHTATAAKSNSYYGLAIGFTVLSGAASVGSISGGAFNPAVAVLTLIGGGATLPAVAVYAIGPLVGGALAGALFRLSHRAECQSGANPSFSPYAIEFVGTFMLCFTISTAAATSNPSKVLAAASIGSMLMAQVYTGGPTSGGLYNPAATIGVLMRQKLASSSEFPAAKALGYIIVQCAGALAAELVACGVVNPPDSRGSPSPSATATAVQVITAEGIGTCFLVTVILQTATSAKTADKEFFGLAIGFTVWSMIEAVGSVSGAAFNPAVGLLSIARTELSTVLIYMFAPIGGAVLAALAFRLTNYDEFNSDSLLPI